MTPPCIFCSLPSSGDLYRDEYLRVIEDICPKMKRHYLIIPLVHIEEVSLEILQKMWDLLKKFKGPKRIVINVGHPYQEIPHAHLHVMGDNLTGPRILE